MITELISPDNPKWQQALDQCPHDFYHLPAYMELASQFEGGRPVAAYIEHAGDILFAPLQLRNLPAKLGASSHWLDANSGYGYPTPIFSPHAHLVPLLTAFKGLCKEVGIVTAFFRLHPLIPLSLSKLSIVGDLVLHGRTVYMDLSQDTDTIAKNIRRGHRYDIRKLHDCGFEAVFDDWSHYDCFIDLYDQTMLRLGASDFYHFPKSYFYGLRATLGDQVHLCTVMAPNGEIACGGLFTSVGDIVQFHLSGSNDYYRKVAPSKLMLDHVWHWAKNAGHRIFHLGGGLGAKLDGLYQFKAGFSHLTADFYTYRIIVDHAKYSQLNRNWSGNFERVSQIRSDFFPLYRMPVAE